MAVLLDDTTVALRLGLAFAFGTVLGVERELRGQAAGLRTHLLVCLGSCLFTLASLYAGIAIEGQTGGAGDPLRADITRIASQVVVGIGFLGGGAILHHGTTVRGLTTAANLWLTASVGLSVGLGFTFAAAFTVGLALVVLAALRPVERFIARLRRGFRMKKDGDVTDSPP
jgi:putative Mg2+ transporter-C (MgtC) family protein